MQVSADAASPTAELRGVRTAREQGGTSKCPVEPSTEQGKVAHCATWHLAQKQYNC